jgi:hypothetical protein
MMPSALIPWFCLMGASLAAGVLLLIWGFRSGQFAEQDRARFLPLRDEAAQAALDRPGRLTVEVYVLLGLIAAAAIGLVGTLGLVVFRQHGG